MGLGQAIQAFGLSCPLCKVGLGLLGGPEVPGRGRQPGVGGAAHAPGRSSWFAQCPREEQGGPPNPVGVSRWR